MSETMKGIFSESIAGRVGTALNHWKLSRPGTIPDFLIVGERIKSQMLISGLLEYRLGNAMYGSYRVLFAENTDACMFVSASPG